MRILGDLNILHQRPPPPNFGTEMELFGMRVELHTYYVQVAKNYLRSCLDLQIGKKITNFLKFKVVRSFELHTCLISFIFQNVDTLKMDEKEKANSVTIDAEAETQSQSNLENQSQSGSVIENQEQRGAEFEDMNSAEVVRAVIYDFE